MVNYVKRGRHPADPTGELFSEEHWPLPSYYDMEPDMYVAINRENMTFIGLGEYRVLWAKAIEGLRSGSIVIGPADSGTTYSKFTDLELKLLYSNTTGEEYPMLILVYKVLLLACKQLGLELKPIPTPACLMRQTRYTNVEGTVTGRVPPQPKKTNTPKPKGPVARPKAGTATGRVWDIADKVWEEVAKLDYALDKKVIRSKIIEQCTEAGINPATAQVQFGKWKGTKDW